MANKINKGNPQRPQPVAQKKETSVPVPFFPDLKMPAWIYEFKAQAIVVAVLSILLYANTFRHEYALDDTIVIAKNEYVYEGFAGIGSILTKDAFDSYYKQFNSSNQLSGGRYRPLSIVTFAVEQQFLGPIPAGKVLDSVVAHAGEAGPQEEKFNRQMQTRHVLQVVWFTMSMVVLLLFLRYVVFKKNPLVAFITTLLFIAHPIHTEVIANVKSRDEIMSLMFIGLTFISAFKYYEKNDKKWLGFGMVFYLLAFLSKEYAVSLIILMPLAFYLFNDFSMSKSLSASLPYFGVMAVYMVIRLQIVAPMSEDSVNDILNNPYALADEQQQLATKISTTLNYLKLLIFPHPLSADYSYNTIPYSDFTNLMVWVSLIVHILIIRYFFYFLKRRHVLSFAIAFYIGNLLLINNIIFNIGGTMGERLIYHSSLGFCMAVAYGLNMAAQKIGSEAMGRVALAGSLLLVIGLFGFKTIDRNQYWKNDHTLFFEDIKVAPNSVLVNADVASSYVNMSDYIKDEKKKEESIRNGIKYFSRAIEINPAFVSGYLNRGMAYFKLKVPDSAVYNLKKVQELYPRYPRLDEMFFNVGVNFYVEQKFPQAIDAWQHSLKSNPQYPQALNALAVMRKEGEDQVKRYSLIKVSFAARMSTFEQLRIVFFGTPDFAVASLDALVNAGANIVAVVTAPDKPAGRGMQLQASAVKQYALLKDLPVLQPEKMKAPEFLEQLRGLNADLQIVVAFRMMPEVVWNMPPMGTINVHGSLLPQYRGAAPINRAIMNGESVTGVTTFKLKHQIDTGDILLQEKVPILPEDNAGTMHDKLMAAGAALLVKTVKGLAEGSLEEVPQDDADESTIKYAPKIFKEDTVINWERPGAEIHDFVRGLSPYPAAITKLGDKSIKVYSTTYKQEDHGAEASSYDTDHSSYLRFAAKDGWVYIHELQQEGKKRWASLTF